MGDPARYAKRIEPQRVLRRDAPSGQPGVERSDPDQHGVGRRFRRRPVTGPMDLVLPADDALVATIHYYLPMPFTHQGAWWEPGADK